MMRLEKIPSDACVFGLLDAPIGRGMQRRQELLYQFEALLPQPMDELQIIFSQEFDGKVLACGCSRTRVLPYRSTAERLVPESLPDWIQDQVPVHISESLNLLTGQFQPLSIKQYERTTAKLVSVVALLIAVAVFLSVQSRVRTLSDSMALVDSQTTELFRGVLPPSSGPNTQPDAIRFATLLNTVQSTRTGVGEVEKRDLVSDLASILGGWPTEVDIQMQSLELGKDAVRVQLTVQQDQSVSDVIAKLSELQDWAILSRTSTPRSDGVDLNIQFTRRLVQEPVS